MTSSGKCLTWFAIMGIALLNSVAWAEEFTAEFELRLSSYHPATKVRLGEINAAGNFFFRNGEWLIRFQTNQFKGFQTWETGSDGRLVYQVRRNSLYVDEGKMGAISRGPVPDWDLGNDQMNVLWMAYASHDYLKKSTNDYLPKICPLRNGELMNTEDYLMKANWLLADTAPAFTRQITFIDDLSPIDSADNEEQSSNLKRIGSGVTNAVYQCLTTTNVGGMILPLRFSFEIFHHRTNDERMVTILFEGITLSASSKCEPASLLPEIPKALTANFKKGSGPRNVSDKRFGKSLKGFYYHMREKWLTDDEEVKRLPEYQLTLVQQPKRYRKDVKDAAPENSRPAGNRGQ